MWDSKFFLLSLLYYYAGSTSLSLGIGYYTIYRPIITGLLCGIILGDITTGMITGAIVNVIFIDFVSTGGSFKADQCLTAIIASIATIVFKFSIVEAAALAYPFGFIGKILWKYRLKSNSFFVKIYDKKYMHNQKPNISLYDGFYPQIILFFMSMVIFIVANTSLFYILEMLGSNIQIIKKALSYIGLFLILISIFNIVILIKTKYSIVNLITIFLISYFLNRNLAIIIVSILFVIYMIKDKELFFKSIKNENNNNSSLSKKDLIRSWFIWMNFSHSCYSFERMQGMGFAHSLKNIFYKLYNDKNIILESINNHTEFFNTEPNMGTPILGYVISLEEKKSNNLIIDNEFDVHYIKKAFMGVVAGSGDSFNQVVLTPLLVSISIMLCLSRMYFISGLSIAFLGILILLISYRGFMEGYYLGKQSFIDRVLLFKNSKLRKSFPYVFSATMGVLSSELIKISYERLFQSSFSTTIIMVTALVYVLINNHRSHI